MSATVLHGDCLAVMPTLDAASVDAIVCDPPYGLEFMGKDWDAPWKNGFAGHGFTDGAERHAAPQYGGNRNPVCMACHKHQRGRNRCECPLPQFDETPASNNQRLQSWFAAVAREAFRVLKPGGHFAAFGGTRTFHRLTCAVEDSGFDVRDCLSWLYGSGFPKSHNGPWGGTALKPAWEPIILARKPLAGTVAANHAAHGTGALNIDGCRIAGDVPSTRQGGWFANGGNYNEPTGSGEARATEFTPNAAGRWPANVVLGCDCEAKRAEAREIVEEWHALGGPVTSSDREDYTQAVKRVMGEHAPGCAVALLDAQSGERKSGKLRAEVQRGKFGQNGVYNPPGDSHDMGRDYEASSGGASRFYYTAKASRRERGEGNTHPTVKPLALMRWLCRLVTPPGGLILDPFMGSGTTGCAAVLEGFGFLGIEQSEEYCAIARRRIAHWTPEPTLEVA